MDDQECTMKGKSAVATALSDFWGERTPREKKLITIGGAVLALVVLYSVALGPALSGRAKLRADLPAMQRCLAQMTADANEARSLAVQAQGRAPTGNALKEALAASLAQRGLAATQLNVAGPNVQLQLKNGQFGSWVAWLDDVRRQFKVKVSQAHVSALKDDGQVDVTATLQPANTK
ncbi:MULTISPECIES: type II secretion system protein GspM [Mycetohabitans]|uniref:type II secretion system protein GspM n=2 Tax=Burkholderiaceae TaxID=119060 RepID=UPI0011159FA7|nr:type II secretion system protein M [Mycetohabitans sp. B7]